MPALIARAFRPLVSGLRALGQDPVALLAEVGVDIATLDKPETPGRRRGYLLYFFGQAEQARAARIERSIGRILTGRGLDD